MAPPPSSFSSSRQGALLVLLLSSMLALCASFRATGALGRAATGGRGGGAAAAAARLEVKGVCRSGSSSSRSGSRSSAWSKRSYAGRLRAANTEEAVDDAPVTHATGAQVRVRFAPSPTGTLHVGGARTALFNYLKAKQEGGKFILRVEDTDEARSTRESEDSMLQDLRWLGLEWDEGPDKNGTVGPYRQSERGDIYKAMAEKLAESGHAYPCFSTEEELEANRAAAEAEGRAPQYDGKWRDADPAKVQEMLDAGVPHTYRFKVPKGKVVVIEDSVRGRVAWDAEATVGDFILLRSSGVPVYNFCVAVDDATMGISHVIRAEEHLTNTLRQCLILDALGKTRPRYAHCSLILGEDRSKLSKRHGATSVGQFKQEGFLPEAMVNYLALLGWNDGTEKEIFTQEELNRSFDLNRVVKSSAVFDMSKLRWVNGQHLRSLTEEQLLPLAGQALVDAGVCKDAGGELATFTTKVVKEGMELISDVVPLTQVMLQYSFEETIVGEDAKEIASDGFYQVADYVVKAYEAGTLPTGGEGADDPEGPKTWKAFVKAAGKDMERKGKRLYHPLRVALTGSMSGADIGQQLTLLKLAEKEGVEGVVGLPERMEVLKNYVESSGGREAAAEAERAAAEALAGLAEVKALQEQMAKELSEELNAKVEEQVRVAEEACTGLQAELKAEQAETRRLRAELALLQKGAASS